jgi:hypothetical protein
LRLTSLAEDLAQQNTNLNLIENKLEEKYYVFSVRKTIIHPNTMRTVQISQTIEPVNDKSKIWFASPLEEITENLLCEEQIISYEKGEGFIWLTNTHENNTITIKKGICLVEIQLISEHELDKRKYSKRNLVILSILQATGTNLQDHNS